VSKIIDAVAVIISCEEEIFAIQRQNYLKAFPGYWAFPGGKVEKDDEKLFFHSPLTQGLNPQLFGAGLREIKEELGVDLTQEILRNNVERIDNFGLALTPDFNPLRFSTTFFRVHLKQKIPFIVDHNEAQFAQWVRAHELLERYERGEILAVPPVVKIIQTLGENPNARSIIDLNFTYDIKNQVPVIEPLRGIRQLMPLSNTLPPAHRTNAFLIGDEGLKVLVDPSPKDSEEYQKLKNTIDNFGLDKILLTHHHPDHHEHSTLLAQEYGVSMLMSADTFERLMKSRPDYFKGIQIDLLKEGDIVTRWLGRDVVVYEIPGHDEGQIALAASDLSWFIAGDLFQGVGTVVIGGEEGNMKKYFETLEKVIRLNPKVLFPSHGIALGGISMLEFTLAHRKMREEQILKLTNEGLKVEDILTKLYTDVDQRLWPYARMNIEKHLEKLQTEGRV
jgi:endoribonuclease LACTB2